MYHTILVPLDGSKRAEAILPHVEEMAAKYSAKVVLLKVEEPAILLGWDEVIDLQKYKEERKQQRKETESYLAKIQNKLSGRGIDSETLVKYNSLVVTEILSTAENVNADILAMASHGHGGEARTFYGSVAVGVLNQIDRPLLLIRSRRE
jgi:nucleotide-binding universal stress UspA family protein